MDRIFDGWFQVHGSWFIGSSILITLCDIYPPPYLSPCGIDFSFTKSIVFGTFKKFSSIFS